MTSQSNKPIITERDRGFSVSIFKREKDGKTYYGACLQRSYLKPEGDPKNSADWVREQINLFPDDMLKLSNLCIGSYNSLTAYLKANKPAPTGGYPQQEMSGGQATPPDDEIPF